jgi:hypothetical protein
MIVSVSLSEPVLAETNEQPQQVKLDDEDDDGLAFYDSNAGTFYAGIWQHLTAPRNLEKDSPSLVSNPAERLTDNHSNLQ